MTLDKSTNFSESLEIPQSDVGRSKYDTFVPKVLINSALNVANGSLHGIPLKYLFYS